MNDQQSTKATSAILILLFIFAVSGFGGCIAFGINVSSYLLPSANSSTTAQVIAETGNNGGAIGCGIFGAVSLYAFVKVFLARTN